MKSSLAKRADQVEDKLIPEKTTDIEKLIEAALAGEVELDPSIEALLDEYEDLFLDDGIFIKYPGYLLRFFDKMYSEDVLEYNPASNSEEHQGDLNGSIEDSKRYVVPNIDIPEWMKDSIRDGIETIDLTGIEPPKNPLLEEILSWDPLKKRI